jgi:hypothetical protein
MLAHCSWRNGRNNGNAGKFAMSALIVGLVSSDHRRSPRRGSIKALRQLPAVMLLFSAAVAVAAEEPSKPLLEKNSFYLSSAGFRIQVANDPAGLKALRALPPHRFVTNGTGDATRYLYAEPTHCNCIFVGTQQAYDRYRNLLSQPLKPTDSVSADYKSQAGILLSNQPLRQSTRGDPTNPSDYLGTLR